MGRARLFKFPRKPAETNELRNLPSHSKAKSAVLLKRNFNNPMTSSGNRPIAEDRSDSSVVAATSWTSLADGPVGVVAIARSELSQNPSGCAGVVGAEEVGSHGEAGEGAASVACVVLVLVLVVGGWTDDGGVVEIVVAGSEEGKLEDDLGDRSQYSNPIVNSDSYE